MMDSASVATRKLFGNSDSPGGGLPLEGAIHVVEASECLVPMRDYAFNRVKLTIGKRKWQSTGKFLNCTSL